MAKALDDNELVFQLQLEENKKVSNQTRKAGVPSDLFQVCLPTGKSSHVPRFCDTKRNGGGRNNFYTRLNSNDYSKPSLDRLIAEQVQLETDKDIAKELDKDINNLEEQDRILAERMQLESDLESAKELDKHNSVITNFTYF
ncbi:hypothetical protein LOTGIDRAFT_158799 [Lottia gigantea]|uniref:Uncharacterized protein n=1 Tax=Lottia gigantea TaxID=225164 RepID=V4CAM1_LOTGI|nr:hypothetical protein LOTGIDRAFT_158799 [Lottia gigantea]ESO98849.1 hypothetical protein LOTGIDRAFT_158799 [Lottia gigantea]